MNCVGNEKITRKTLEWKIIAVIMEFILSVFSGKFHWGIIITIILSQQSYSNFTPFDYGIKRKKVVLAGCYFKLWFISMCA